eukprot:gene34529-41809_t
MASLCTIAVVFVHFVCVICSHSSSNLHFLSSFGDFKSNERNNSIQNSQVPLLILDVDGTLYEDDCSIEHQIKDNFHGFAKEHFGIDSDECERLHLTYGCGVRGIAEEITGNRNIFVDYFNEVFSNLDLSKLNKYTQSFAGSPNTGYDFTNMQRAHRALLSLPFPIILASNSPASHVRKVINRLGLGGLRPAMVLTPERRGGLTKNEEGFWKPLLQAFPPSLYVHTLLDDNLRNIECVRALGMEAVHITPDRHLDVALAEFICDPLHNLKQTLADTRPIYIPDDNVYLQSKNVIDKASINSNTLQLVVQELRGLRKERVQVLDVGAGHVNMLDILMNAIIRQAPDSSSSISHVDYVALESNGHLYGHIHARMLRNGLRRVCVTSHLNHSVYVYEGKWGAGTSSSYKKSRGAWELWGSGGRQEPRSKQAVSVRVFVCDMDFMHPSTPSMVRSLLTAPLGSMLTRNMGAHALGYDLIVGSCVADLHPPQAFVSQLLEFDADQGGLVYLPITFNGVTKIAPRLNTRINGTSPSSLSPSHGLWDGIMAVFRDGSAADAHEQDVQQLIQKSVRVFDLYHQHLERMGHSIQTISISDALAHAGGTSLMAPSPSGWRVWTDATAPPA